MILAVVQDHDGNGEHHRNDHPECERWSLCKDRLDSSLTSVRNLLDDLARAIGLFYREQLSAALIDHFQCSATAPGDTSQRVFRYHHRQACLFLQ